MARVALRFRNWWGTARSSVLTHRTMKWGWVALWIVAEITGLVYDVGFISRLSLVALILGSWSAEEAAKAEEKNEEAQS